MERDSISVVIPAKNEANTIGEVINGLVDIPEVGEVIVINDCSGDETAAIAEQSGARVISNPYSKGNGAAIKAGARLASGDVVIFMDADGQHSPSDVKLLIDTFEKGFDMVVAKRDSGAHENTWRLMANTFYNKLASWMVGHEIEDLTSGFRIVCAHKFREFLSLLPNGFSYPTTSTMAFFRAGYSVGYVPVKVNRRGGKSHIRIFRDGVRFFLIIFKVGTLYSPLKLFFPVSMAFFCMGSLNYLYTYFVDGRFTNMSALLLIVSMLTFLMGLMSEQMTSLLYKEK
jgi:glycosyltransferase involved in cell wall biosynthesis